MYVEADLINCTYRALTLLQDRGPFSHYTGICNNVFHLGGSYELLLEALPLWPEYSGNIEFPVHGYCKYDASTAYQIAIFWPLKNTPPTPYQAARLRLLAFLVEYFKHEAAYWWSCPDTNG